MHRVLYRLRFNSGDFLWGDYGYYLHHGIAWNRVDGLLQLERTGPNMPALTIPGTRNVVVVDSLRRRLLESPLTGYSFLPVVKHRIVHLDWEAWPKRKRPKKYPAGGEPENYIRRRKHHPPSAHALGDLWELMPTTKIDFRPGKPPTLLSGESDEDFFGTGPLDIGLYLSTRAKRWFESEVPECVSFRRVPAA